MIKGKQPRRKKTRNVFLTNVEMRVNHCDWWTHSVWGNPGPVRGRHGGWAPEDTTGKRLRLVPCTKLALLERVSPERVRAWCHAAPGTCRKGALGDGTDPVYHCQSQRRLVSTPSVRSLFLCDAGYSSFLLSFSHAEPSDTLAFLTTCTSCPSPLVFLMLSLRLRWSGCGWLALSALLYCLLARAGMRKVWTQTRPEENYECLRGLAWGPQSDWLQTGPYLDHLLLVFFC